MGFYSRNGGFIGTSYTTDNRGVFDIISHQLDIPSPFIQLVTTDLILHLDASNTSSYSSGSTWYDLSSTGNDGTITGATHTSGVGGYFDFNGSSDHVRMGSDMFNPNLNFTFSSWVNSDVTATATIVSDHLTSGSIQIRFTNTSSVQIVDNYVVNVGTFSNFTYSTGTWYNVVVTRSTNTYTLYVNGSYKSDFTSTNSYSYGAQTIGANNNGSERWNGKISQIACYSRAISSTEVTENWNALKSSYGY